jgi:GAF domain-containing protein
VTPIGPDRASGDVSQVPELSAAVTRLAGLVLSRETVETALALVTEVAATTIAGSMGAGVTVVNEHGKRSKAMSDPVVERADALQYELDEGPCLTAWRTRQVVRVDDTASDRRWARWCSAAVHLHIRSVLSAPLVVADETIGAIKVYSREPAGYTERDEGVMGLFAAHAAILLANAQGVQEARRLSRQLGAALAGRDAVNRAEGALLARGAPDEEAAFALLADAARRSGGTVEDAARDLLAALRRRAGSAAPRAG